MIENSVPEIIPFVGERGHAVSSLHSPTLFSIEDVLSRILRRVGGARLNVMLPLRQRIVLHGQPR